MQKITDRYQSVDEGQSSYIYICTVACIFKKIKKLGIKHRRTKSLLYDYVHVIKVIFTLLSYHFTSTLVLSYTGMADMLENKILIIIV